MARCKGCRAEIVWRFTEKGERMPLDAKPTRETGQGVYVFDGAEHIRAYLPLLDGDVERYMNHWATCPMSREFHRRAS